MKNILLFIVFNCAFLLQAQNSVGGFLSSNDATHCGFINNGLITLNGHTGTILRWEYSFSGGDPWTPIAHTSTNYSFSNLSRSTFFRVIVQLPNNTPTISTAIEIRVVQQSVSGTISGQSDYCTNSHGELRLVNHVGSVVNWEYSMNNGVSWLVVANSALRTELITTFNQNTTYRVEVKNEICPSVKTPSFDVNVHVPNRGGVITGQDSICSGVDMTHLTLNDAVGTDYLWESSHSQFGPWINTTIVGPTFQQNNIQQDQFYRVRVTNQYCSDEYSTTFKVVASQLSIGGSITGVQEVCKGQSVALNLTNYQGSIKGWESSLDEINWRPVNNTQEFYSIRSNDTTTFYRVLIKNGFCESNYSTVKRIEVEPLPIIDFQFTNACERSGVVITNYTSGQNLYRWFFGDGTSEQVRNPIHSYSYPGTYSIQLVATSLNNCMDSISKVIEIYPKPNVQFYHADTLCFGDYVRLENRTSILNSSIIDYQWSLGVSGFSSLEHPSYQQFILGSNVIKLKAISNYGCADSIAKTIVLRDRPTPDFLVENSCVGNRINYVNQSFSGASQSSYSWSFGDGVSSHFVSPQHTYTEAGSYLSKLIVRTNYGCLDSIQKEIHIHPQPIIDFTFTNNCLNDSSFFSAQVSGVSNYSVYWDFQNGGTSNVMEPSFFYPYQGLHPVLLRVVSDSNCVQELVKTIEVYPKPVANFLVSNTCTDDVVQFTNLSTVQNSTYESYWILENEVISSDHTPSTIYRSPGIYYPRLIVSSAHQCSDTITKLLEIYDRPIADFQFQNVCYGFPIEFTNMSTVTRGLINSYVWNFGDNSNSTLSDPIKEYLNEGIYSISLIVVSTLGCKDTIQKTANIYEAPIADFEVINACDGQALTFNNTTQLSIGMFNTTWDFGDLNVSSEFAPVHLYDQAGIYTVIQKIETDLGCFDSIIKSVIVYPLPNVEIDEVGVQIQKGETIQLVATGAVDYTWFPAYYMNNTLIANPTIQPQTTTTYFVSGMNEYNCLATDSILVTVEESYYVKPYNFITPDGNGENDFWVIEYILSYPDNKVILYDEMGHEVYSKTAYDNTWDGKNKTGEILPDGVYYYLLVFEHSDKKYTGSVLLIRN